MLDVSADSAVSAQTGANEERGAALCFASLIFDVDACTLTRKSGEAIPLTRGELALLREFVRRPGRVLSRDQLLDAVVGRRAALFDRSVDVLVGRLRRKIEPDPKQPSVIVTVPGEGYRFSAALTPAKSGAATVGSGPIPALPVHAAPWWRFAIDGPGGGGSLPLSAGRRRDRVAPGPAEDGPGGQRDRPALRQPKRRQRAGLSWRERG